MVLCLAVVSFVLASVGSADPLLVNPCLDEHQPFSKMPFCDSTLALDQRVRDAVKRMTLQEKISALGHATPAIKSLGLPEYNWWSEASSGVSSRALETTKFSFPITTAMSFNRTLWHAVGQQIGREARAAANMGKAYSTFWAPVINLAREPRWGRNIETPGEDPYVTGQYAEYFVKGFQEAPEDPYHLQASACCKHYVANEMEKTLQTDGEKWDRHNISANITMQDLVDSYLKPFQDCVEKGRVSSLMCSYNSVNGVPSCANDWLLQTVARENWGFDGYITSDCDADADVFNRHNYTKTPEETVRDVLRAGTDLDCGDFVQKYAQSALDKGLITEADVDARLQMLFRVRMRLSHFDPLGPLNHVPENVMCSDYSVQLSHDGARQSTTLIKNEGNRLPLNRATAGTVAIIGPNAFLSKEDASYYGPINVCGGNFWTLVDAMSQGGEVKTTNCLGVPNVTSEDQSGIPQAVEMAASADTVVLAVGTDLTWSHEAHDAANISFTTAQLALIEKVSAAAKQTVIAVVMTATPLDLSPLLTNPKVGAVLYLGQPSVTVLGVGKIVYGDESPAGRMVQTVYESSYQNQISIFDFGMRPGPSSWARPDCTNPDISKCPRGINPGRTYRFYTGTPIVPFGFGMSYTTFSYSVVRQPSEISLAQVQLVLAQSQAQHHLLPQTSRLEETMDRSGWGDLLQYNIKVTNTGNTDSDDVVLGFLTPPGAGVDGVPLKVLFGFERVHVKAGQSVTVTLYPSLLDFTQANIDGRLLPHPGVYSIHFGLKETVHHGMGYVEALPLRATLLDGSMAYFV